MLHIKTFTFGMFEVNNYLLFDSDTKEAVLIDTGKDPVEIIETIDKEQLNLKLLLYTHAHIDHVEGYSTIHKAYPDVPVWLHKEEQFWIDALSMQAQMFQVNSPEPPEITEFVKSGQIFELTNFSIEPRFCPGHTPGGISYYVKEGPYLFTGDTIFAGSIGRTDLAKGDLKTLINSINNQILTLPNETVVYPGHGPSTTVGVERQTNPFIQEYGLV